MKGYVSNLLRQLGLLYGADKLRYHVMQWKNRGRNAAFKQQHPDIALPPDYLIYESFQLDYQQYYHDSKDTAQWLVDYFRKYTTIQPRTHTRLGLWTGANYPPHASDAGQ